MTEKSIPQALYGCHFCGDEYSHPADALFWSESFQAWVCDSCWDDQDKHWDHESGSFCKYGISLEKELENRKQFMAELYKIEGTARIDGKPVNTSKVAI